MSAKRESSFVGSHTSCQMRYISMTRPIQIAVALLWVVPIVSCDLMMQDLKSPCASDEPEATDTEFCPPCETDADCVIASNPCYREALCVPEHGGWVIDDVGCSPFQKRDVPPASSCGCVENVCREN